jgi:integrase
MVFTEKAVEKLQCAKKRLQFVDDETTGLTLRVATNGRKSLAFYVRVCGTQVYVPLGEWPQVSVKVARAGAIELGGKAATWKRGGCLPEENPFTTRTKARTTTPTFAELCERYISDHLRGESLNPQRAERDVRYLLKNRFAAWLETPIDRITPNDVLAVKNACGKHRHAANQAVEFAKRVFTWSAGSGENGLVNFWECANPARNIKMFPCGMKTARKRFLEPGELVTFNSELQKEQGDFRDVVALLLATGARKSNVYSMRWADISFDLNTWHIPISKSGEGYDVYLTDAAIEVLERRHANRTTSPWVFPAVSASGHISDIKKKWGQFRKRCGFPDLRLHDLRRSKGAYAAISGVSLQKIKDLLGHKSMASTLIYARLNEASVQDASRAADLAMKSAMDNSSKKTRKAVPMLAVTRA